MKFGLSADNYNFIKKSIHQYFGPDVTAYCFGSRARGDQQKYSDLDVMIQDQNINDAEVKLGQLQEALEESNLPIKVDIVLESHFASSYFDSYLADRIIF